MAQGITLDDARFAPLFDSTNHKFLPRSSAEEDVSFKQLIPYILVTCGDTVLRYERSPKGEEKRLHNLMSIGVGGHINREDASLAHSLEREFLEELALDQVPPVTRVAMLNDDSIPVNRVHLGVIYVAEVDAAHRDTIASGDVGIRNPKFVSRETLRAEADKLESWSQICLARLDEILSRKPAALPTPQPQIEESKRSEQKLP